MDIVTHCAPVGAKNQFYKLIVYWNLFQVDIRAVTVESHLAGRLFPGTREDIIAFMDKVGYNHVVGAHRQTNDLRSKLGTTDDLFVRKEIKLREKDEL